MSYVEYNSNNSGGSWWLTDKNWKDLEKAGWKVKWATLGILYQDDVALRELDGMPKLIPLEDLPPDDWQKSGMFCNNGRYMGALAKSAYRAGLSLRAAAEEWEKVTGQNACDAGCSCCGQPHNFTEYDDEGKYVRSGPQARYEASWDD